MDESFEIKWGRWLVIAKIKSCSLTVMCETLICRASFQKISTLSRWSLSALNGSQTTFFLFKKRFLSAASSPDLSEPAIGWDRTKLEIFSIFIWFFTLDVSVIVIFVFHKNSNWFIRSNVSFGGTEIIIRSILLESISSTQVVQRDVQMMDQLQTRLNISIKNKDL